MNIWNSFMNAVEANLIRDNRWLLMLKGLGITLEVTFCSVIIGTIIGLIICLCRLSKIKPVRWIGDLYVWLIRGTPTVIQLMIIYFGIFATTRIPKEIAAMVAFGMNSGAYMAELMRGGILAVGQGQTEAGRSLGLSNVQTKMYIVFPQALKNALPAYISEIIVLLKETAIVSIVGLKEITGYANYIRSRTFAPFFPLLVAAGIYLVLTSILTKVFSVVERRLRQGDIR